MRKPKLKPCPFCGAHLYYWLQRYVHPDNNCVIAEVCEGLKGRKDYKDWNTRIKEENESCYKSEVKYEIQNYD